MDSERSAGRPPFRLAAPGAITEVGGNGEYRPGFALRPLERTTPLNLSPEFIDRCRKAFHSIEFDDGPRVLGVTSALYGDGKTSVAIGLATAVGADTGEPTVLLECDFEHPSFARIFGIHPGHGLTDSLKGDDHARAVRMAPLDNVFVVTAGEVDSDPARTMYQLNESNFIDDLRRQYRNIIIDLPPMLSIAYSTLACRLSDRILLVARYGVTPLQDLEKVVQLMGRDRVSGVVLNAYASKVPVWLRRLF